eukprot:g6710.t1
MSPFPFDPRATFSECLNTAILVYFGIGTAVLTGDPFLTSLVFGTMVSVLIYNAQHSDGGQLNPAVTIALAFSGYIPFTQAAINCAAQMVGGVVGSALLFASMPRDTAGNLGSNQLQEGFDIHHAVVAETISAFFLQFSVFEAFINPRNKAGKLAPLALGFVVFIAHALLIPIDGASLNPARSFGTALLTNTWDDFWVFFLCPTFGCLLAIPAHSIFLKEDLPIVQMSERSKLMRAKTQETKEAETKPVETATESV